MGKFSYICSFCKLICLIPFFIPPGTMHCPGWLARCDGNHVLYPMLFLSQQEAGPTTEACVTIAFIISAIRLVLWQTHRAIQLLWKPSITALKTNNRRGVTSNIMLTLCSSWYISNSDSTRSTTGSCPTRKSHPAGLESCLKPVWCETATSCLRCGCCDPVCQGFHGINNVDK